MERFDGLFGEIAEAICKTIHMVELHHKGKTAARAQNDELDEARPFPWLEIALAASGLALFFQLFPGTWWRVVSVCATALSYIDVRSWSWRSYAAVSALAIVGLAALKAWQENVENRR